MGALFVVSTADPSFAHRAVAAGRRALVRQGHTSLTEVELPGWRVLHGSYLLGGPELVREHQYGYAAIAGTLTVGRDQGFSALATLIEGDGPPAFEKERLGGQFAALVRRAGRTWLFGDWFGSFPLYHDEQRRLFSTSLLAAVAALPRVSLDIQACYEFAFNVTPIGDATVVRDLSLLAPGEVVELTPAGAISTRQPRRLNATPSTERTRDQVLRLKDALEVAVGAQADAATRGVRCPLSGGIDSRLAFAAMRAAGIQPDLYVYGPSTSVDVGIATAIAAAEGLPIAWTDQHAGLADPGIFAAQVENNFHAVDGLPNFGNIFDAGGNIAVREARHAGGALAVSGGCGEVMRDFFHLPDRPMPVRQVARSFLSRFAPEDASDVFDSRRFVDTLAGKLAGALDVDDPDLPVPRLLIEQLYPRVRCRALFGREIGLEARYSPYFMPFLDHRFVEAAAQLPMSLRWAGRAEAMLLAAIDPGLAAYPSAYGHDFSGAPSRRHRWSEWTSRTRPAWLRERSYRIRRRLGATGDEHGSPPSMNHMARVVDLSFPRMSVLFRPERVRDPALWRRIACLEYFAEAVGADLRM